MTPAQARTYIASALTEEAAAYAGPDGSTPYDAACEWVSQLTEVEGPDHVIDLVLEIAQGGSGNEINWWLRLFGMLEEVRPLGHRAKQRLLELLDTNPPIDLEARAYLLRFLAYVGCAIPWQNLPAGLGLTDLNRHVPLVVADALVWANRSDQAKHLIVESRRRGLVHSNDLRAMAETWHEIAPAENWDEFLKTESTQRTSSEQSPFPSGTFKSRLRRTSCRYQSTTTTLSEEHAGA